MNNWIRISIVAVAAVLSPFISTAQAPEIFNAHFEISINDKTVRANPHPLAGQDVTIRDFGGNLVTLNFERASETEYVLKLVIFSGNKGAESDEVLFSKNFKGVFGTPMELNGRADGMWLSGAISVTVLK